MRIDRPKRGRKAAKRLDLTDIKHVLRDDRQWCSIGLVVTPEDGSSYWRVEPNEDGSGAVDILVEVVLQPTQDQVTARLTAGMWMVPALGEEVVVVIPSGRINFMPTIVGLLSSNIVPTGSDAPTPTRLVLMRAEVVITDGNGGTEPLVRKSDFDGHTHGVGTYASLSGTTGGGLVVGGVSGGAPAVSGTAVLKAK